MRLFKRWLVRRAWLGLIVSLLILPAAPTFADGARLADLQQMTRAARSAYRAGNLIGALALSQKIAAAAERRFGGNHIRHAQALNNLALFQDLNGSLNDAAANYQRAIAIVETQRHDHRPLLADLKNNLAAVVLQQCRMGEARGLYADALALTEANFGTYHPETELVRANVDNLDRFAAGKATGEQAAQLGRLFKSCVS